MKGSRPETMGGGEALPMVGTLLKNGEQGIRRWEERESVVGEFL